MVSSSAQTALGEFLRARRAQLDHTDLGLPLGTGRRRAPGLRREEMAALAGISIDYYIRLEQGKETNPSVSVLRGLARALCLDAEGTEHLFALADRASGRSSRPVAGPSVRPGIRQLLEKLRPCPAYVRSRTNDILASNPEGLALLAGIDQWPAERRNTTRYVFLHPAARTLYPVWAEAAAATVAQLREAVGADPDDPNLTALVEELAEASPEFVALWKRHEVRRRPSDRKTFCHPVAGEITFLYESLEIEPGGQRLAIYQTPPGNPDHEAVHLLSLTPKRPQSR
ncbi:helix-turn-helix domain-containing protein [Microtetraspora niveoalba]|uniref:helix-turn-helix domain-containing protein n=1 Tax=Microtetraspora niveoalba TaxID=46175 RepID=UPI000A80967A|nr:helix-turn-helix transcriptional regulator [Microtetraspora niveoalba]